MSSNNICYTGIGSKKSGNHTRRQFLQTMEKNFKKKCAVHMKSLKCNACKKSITMNSKEVRKQIQAQMKNKTYKMSKATEKRLVKQMKKCDKCKNRKLKKCSIDDYIIFSGAEYGSCEQQL